MEANAIPLDGAALAGAGEAAAPVRVPAERRRRRSPARDYLELRGRLLLAVAAAIEERGYAAMTVADVVRHARVSRRTFYEHFEDREDSFLALFDATTEWLVKLIAEAVDPELPWQQQLERALDAYLRPMAAQPQLTRSLLFEIYSTGARGVERRRAANRRFAEQLCVLVEAARARNPELTPISLEMATAITGGLRELAMLAAEEGREADVEQLRRVASDLISGVVAPRR